MGRERHSNFSHGGMEAIIYTAKRHDKVPVIQALCFALLVALVDTTEGGTGRVAVSEKEHDLVAHVVRQMKTFSNIASRSTNCS